ncbi:MAG: DUF2341 domain-containing protein [Asgard group archaeon]|nr:DUF2341 domain-containing protein [Asgard group archaeon]
MKRAKLINIVVLSIAFLLCINVIIESTTKIIDPSIKLMSMPDQDQILTIQSYNDWAYYKNIYIDNNFAGVNDFPVFIQIEYESGKMNVDYSDLRFVANEQELDFEIEYFDSNYAYLWIKIPTFLSGTNEILMFYGNSGANSTAIPQNVWDNDYVIVQHLEETSGLHYDSSKCLNNGTNSGSNQNVQGKIAKANEFDGVNDYVQIPEATNLKIRNAITMEAWINPQIYDYWNTIMAKSESGDGYRIVWGPSNVLKADFYINSVRYTPSTTSLIPSNTWSYVAATFDGSYIRLYVNGGLWSVTSAPGLINDNSYDFTIGDWIDHNNERGFDGSIDEVRVSNITRSSNWLALSYDLVENQATRVVFGEEQINIPDSDSDGLNDQEESTYGTNATNPDTDGDGLLDGEEVKFYYSNPLAVDTDFDGLTDFYEADYYFSHKINSFYDFQKILDSDIISEKTRDYIYFNFEGTTDSVPFIGENYVLYFDYTTSNFELNLTIDWNVYSNYSIYYLSFGVGRYDKNTGSLLTNQYFQLRDTLESTSGEFRTINNVDNPEINTHGSIDNLGLVRNDVLFTMKILNGTSTMIAKDGEELLVNQTYENLKTGISCIFICYGHDTTYHEDYTQVRAKNISATIEYPNTLNLNSSDTDLEGLSDFDEINIYNTNPGLNDTDYDTITDYDELFIYGTNPLESDTDLDGMNDAYEIVYGLNPITNDSELDFDNDNLINIMEYNFGTNPTSNDTDLDGLYDYSEIMIYNTNPTNNDTDSDLLSDFDEVITYNTNPTLSDTDYDLVNDWAEIFLYSINPLDNDTDDDMVLDGIELQYGTDPNTNDTDLDLLSDYDELYIWNTNPTYNDTDSDSLMDYSEVIIYNTNPLDSDTDGDALLDGEEVFLYNTNPNNNDTDGDSYQDGIEIEYGSDPNDDQSIPEALDSDSDGIPDFEETILGTNPYDPDTDHDGINDYNEVYVWETNPNSIDSDSDTLYDYYEIFIYETDPNDPDSDGDFLDDNVELFTYGTDPNEIDTDDDNIGDYLEIFYYYTNPSSDDSDYDNLSDYDEIFIYETNPLSGDSDNDYLNDFLEIVIGTDPNNEDTDGDGVNDGDEYYSGRNPLKIYELNRIFGYYFIPIYALIVVIPIIFLSIRARRRRQKELELKGKLQEVINTGYSFSLEVLEKDEEEEKDIFDGM